MYCSHLWGFFLTQNNILWGTQKSIKGKGYYIHLMWTKDQNTWLKGYLWAFSSLLSHCQCVDIWVYITEFAKILGLFREQTVVLKFLVFSSSEAKKFRQPAPQFLQIINHDRKPTTVIGQLTLLMVSTILWTNSFVYFPHKSHLFNVVSLHFSLAHARPSLEVAPWPTDGAQHTVLEPSQ